MNVTLTQVEAFMPLQFTLKYSAILYEINVVS